MKIVIALVLSAVTGLVPAQSFPSKPVHGIADTAHLISKKDGGQIRKSCESYREKWGGPMVVATIPSLKAEHAAKLTIEQYARKLFDHWKIGSQNKNFGVLVLVSKGDRRARIEMGAGWTHRFDDEAHEIMSTEMVPKFKKRLFSRGIAAGVSRIAKFNPEGEIESDPGTIASPPTETFKIPADNVFLFWLVLSYSSWWSSC